MNNKTNKPMTEEDRTKTCVEGCDECKKSIDKNGTFYGPSHCGSWRCRMGYSPASGGNSPHCTCNACF